MNTFDAISQTDSNEGQRTAQESGNGPLGKDHSYNLGANAARVSSALNELKQCANQARELAVISSRNNRAIELKIEALRKEGLTRLDQEADEMRRRQEFELAQLKAWDQNWTQRISSLNRNLRSPRTETPIGNVPLQSVDPAVLQTASKRYAEFLKNVELSKEEVEKVQLVCAKLGKILDKSAPVRPYRDDPNAIVQHLRQQLAEIIQDLKAESRILTRLWHSQILPILAFVCLISAGFAIGWFMWSTNNDLTVGALAGGAVAVAGVLTLVLWMLKIGNRQNRIESFISEASSVITTLNAVRDFGKDNLNPKAHVARQVNTILQSEASMAQQMRKQEREAEQWRQRKNERIGELLNRHKARVMRARDSLLSHHQRQHSDHQAHYDALEQSVKTNVELEFKQQQTVATDRLRAIEHTVENTLHHLYADLERANGTLRLRHRAWSDLGWANWEIPAAFPVAIPCARLTNSVADFVQSAEVPAHIEVPDHPQQLELSADLVLPDAGHLLVEGANGLSVLHQAMLRLLVGSPLGKIRFSLIDPIGLGNNFASFLRLRDADENIVGAKVWTSQVEVERVLANLSYHAEKVIQKYLRDKYATLAEYNKVAGDLAEPYQVLVVADFPHGFSDLAIERLASLVQHGPRCGIFVWVHGSATVQFPSAIKRSEFLSGGVVLQHGGSGWQVAHPPLREWGCSVEGMPEPQLMHYLLDEIGKRTAQSANLALPLTASLPDISRRWKANSASELRIPIGRSGADKIQEMVLGNGTAQHVLIGGRTGSGKSTLLHAIICSGAWHFAPDQLEFYLIDFKKGVEFKCYATTQLPHARVVAVESDREFGLSVFRAIDKELDERGKRFRAVGAQDLASYRQLKPAEVMPRTLLVIDEFQELFVEDDAIAHSGAMLLDRFVRQGRAFGIHVILGSQSLGGSSALARSTIGQIGVRIALQCSEADSQLILSDANSVAHLLERPGEAIYNDHSGLKEGNSPFQIFWLDKAQQHALLTDLPHDQQPVPRVFEGSAPVELQNNLALQSLIAAPHEAEQLSCWVGEPNSLGGPCQAIFGPGSAGNLVAIGHHREASLSMVIAAVCAFAASKGPQSLRMRIIDGEGIDDRVGDLLWRLAAELPHDIKVLKSGEAAAEITALQLECTDGKRATVPTVVFVLGLQRVRDMRMADDFAFSGKRGTGEIFADLLANGPDAGINTWICCDSVGNLSRALTRTAQRHLGQRIAFQMSSGDSSDLIDDGSASHLGLYHALYVNLSSGQRVKFRPYSPPSSADVNDLVRAITKKWQA